MNYEALMNRTLQELKPSGIRKFFDIAAEMDELQKLNQQLENDSNER